MHNQPPTNQQSDAPQTEQKAQPNNEPTPISPNGYHKPPNDTDAKSNLPKVIDPFSLYHHILSNQTQTPNESEQISKNNASIHLSQSITSSIPQNTTSFPNALKAAYASMSNISPKANDNDGIDPHSKQEITDIDNLPIYTTEAPILSLQKLRNSASHKKIESTAHHNDKHKKPKKKKYSKFFIKNFFLKKHNDTHHRNGRQNDENDEEEKLDLHRIKMKGNTKEKEMKDLRLSQRICSAHKGAIYCMEFSKKGDFLASGGQDAVLRIWTVCGSRADSKRWKEEEEDESDSISKDDEGVKKKKKKKEYHHHQNDANDIISIVAYREFTGHRADIIDISWSNGEFVLSASIDQTVMLWHTSRTRCLCLFQHSDIVTSVQFHPNEDYLFLSGSFDSRLRLWNILEHRVVDWVQVPTLVTCTTFSINGKFAIAGLYDGQCFFYSTQGHRLKYVTAIECRNSSGKYRKGRKVTGLQYLKLGSNEDHKNAEHGSSQLLISTNDSRLRLYNLSNFDMKCKYKGHENTQSQIHARLSPDDELIICGSEDGYIYIWRVKKAQADESNSIFHSKKSKNRQEYYEYFKSNSKLPQVALFAPHRTIHYIHRFRTESKMVFKNNEDKIKHIILTADTQGHINIYTNHSDDKDYKYPHHYHYHHQNSRHSHRNTKSTKKKKYK